jgi:hypothetical protein
MLGHKESYVLIKLQRGLSATETWIQSWNINISDDKTQVLYFSHRLGPADAHLTSNGRNIPFVNHIKHLGVVFDKRIAWRLHIELTEAKGFRIFFGI